MSKDELMEKWFGKQVYSDQQKIFGYRFVIVGKNRVLKIPLTGREKSRRKKSGGRRKATTSIQPKEVDR